ncbi:MAG: hypothetical protein WCV90_02110 [Candidatus Woesearchaeota archaeon]
MDENIQNIEELRQELIQKKREVSTLRPQLGSISNQKEQSFRDLRSARDKIKFRASKIQELKKTRDDLTKQVKGFKEEREKFNLEVKEKSEERKEVGQKKKELLDKLNIKEDPAKIKHLIQSLESKIETEVMPFSKEQQLNKKIKELKVQLKEVEKLGEVWKEINASSSNLTEVRQKAEESHHSVQTLAKQSQEKHEEINRLYEELKELRNQEQPLAEKYLKEKKEFEELKKKVDELQVRIGELSKLLNEEDEKDYKSRVQEKTAEIKEKIKSRKKLSTEDILAFQASKDRD